MQSGDDDDSQTLQQEEKEGPMKSGCAKELKYWLGTLIA